MRLEHYRKRGEKMKWTALGFLLGIILSFMISWVCGLDATSSLLMGLGCGFFCTFAGIMGDA
jgi:CDP-diglyceride synthetase